MNERDRQYQRVTVSLPPEHAAALRAAAADGTVSSVSAYVAEAVGRQLARDAGRRRLEEIMGGPPPTDMLTLVQERLLPNDDVAEARPLRA